MGSLGREARPGVQGAAREEAIAAYATQADWEALTADNDAVADASTEEVERALEQASRDVDAFLDWPAPTEDTLRLDVEDLSDYQAAQLARATVQQAAYRIARTEAEMSVDDDGIASIGGITFARTRPPRIGPAVAEALQGASLFKRSGTVSYSPEDPAA